ncbi:MAG: metallopeptidase family protein [Marinibacterium sp.]
MKHPHKHRHLPDIEALADSARAALPAAFRDTARDVVVQVADWPTQEMLAELGIKNPLGLTGIYVGIPLTQKSYFQQPEGPDMIWLFRQPILAEWRRRGDVDLAELVTHVLVHEFAHHFGWSDADIASIDRWWE